MGWPVYSERFAVNDGIADWEAYVVPPGHRAVIRGFTATHDGAGQGLVILMVQGHVVARASPGQDQTVALELHLPVYAGEWMAVWCNGSGSFGTVAGYLLQDPAGGRAAAPAGPEQLAQQFPPDVDVVPG